ncbi:hypothetical protein FDP41_010047 [Naegleria fowleri]|uniref:carnosine N-methyltransferase n=1 Tax=Naegleria fowleri TaxID=5763 RepID=A0A6A5BCI7_NAEFO|nr:uncharacterized protein FDP41_010047 [Naegleria fowleri]KAF0971824.1 hypothetical protein FDP41_010047 [Naegleria fowleri]CAG4714780.1 unnamed protein product [Naegleria fowleri]
MNNHDEQRMVWNEQSGDHDVYQIHHHHHHEDINRVEASISDRSNWIPWSKVLYDEDDHHDSHHHHASEEDDDFESEDFVFSKVLIAFSRYERHYFSFLDKKIEYFHRVWNQSLGDIKKHITVSEALPDQFDKFMAMKMAIRNNYENLILKIIESHTSQFLESEVNDDLQQFSDLSGRQDAQFYRVYSLKPRIMEVNVPSYMYRTEDIAMLLNSEDYDKVTSTIKQFVRDWSKEGQTERQNSYHLILNEIERLLPLHGCVNKYKVLTPGAGLGRLTWEIARAGYYSQGNEFSFHMLLASAFILNHPYREVVSEENEGSVNFEQFEIFPFVTHMSDLFSRTDQLCSFKVPDVNPGKLLPDSVEFSMVAGDFVDVYKKESEREFWDCIATCFFIDTAANIFDYLNTIYHSLKDGGYWINLGPLLWHYNEMGENRFSIEITYEELKQVAQKMGFEFIYENTNVENTYISSFGNERHSSMRRTIYHCVLFSARKIPR